MLLTNQRQLPGGTGNPIKDKSAAKQQLQNSQNAVAVGSAVQRYLSLSYAPTVWHADLMPSLGEDAEWAILERRRYALLSAVLAQPVSVFSTLRFHKPEWLCLKHNIQADSMLVEISSLVENLQGIPPGQV